VSVFAPDAVLASRSKCSSMCRVFFIHTIMPYQYGLHNRFPAIGTADANEFTENPVPQAQAIEDPFSSKLL
jgi:hypothetical protein